MKSSPPQQQNDYSISIGVLKSNTKIYNARLFNRVRHTFADELSYPIDECRHLNNVMCQKEQAFEIFNCWIAT